MTLLIRLDMKVQEAGGVSLVDTPNHFFFLGETLQIDAFHFAAGWLFLTNMWNTALAKHLLVCLINPTHRQVCVHRTASHRCH